MRESTGKILLTIAVCLIAIVTYGQERKAGQLPVDSVVAGNVVDSLEQHEAVTLGAQDSATIAKAMKKQKRDWATWKPDPKRAMWLAIVIPGAGQVYNRKYWKLPIIYGGFVGCAYAMRWNNQMYADYSQAYIDLIDDNPATKSYTKFLHLGKTIDDSNKEYYTNIFKNRKDKYRRWRDLSFFCMLGVYAISIIDAYVDASLSQFDISDDLSLRVEPGFVGTQNGKRAAPSLNTNTTGIGVNCSLNF